MLIGSFLKNIKKEFKNHQFTGLSFNSAECKKVIFFLQLKEQNQMEVSSLIMQLKKVQQQLFQKKI